MTEAQQRRELVLLARSLHDRGLTRGTSGNLSVRIDGGILISPTNTSLGRLHAGELAEVTYGGAHVGGPKPSKEAFLHLAMYRARPQDHAAVHLHSTHAVAVSCFADLNHDDVLPPLTAYFVMRVGRLVRLPYFAPGDSSLEAVAQEAAAESKALLLANHGPIVSSASLEEAVDAVEELEETAGLFLLLQDQNPRPLTAEQVARLRINHG